MSDSQVPVATDIRVHYHAGGKVAIEEYGKESYEYGASVSRSFTIPDGWTTDQVELFTLEQTLKIRDELDPLLQEERDSLMAARKF